MLNLSPFPSSLLSLSWSHIKSEMEMCANLRKVLDENVLPFII